MNMNISAKQNYKKFDNFTKNEKLNFLERMWIIRKAELRIANLVEQGKIKTPCHLYIGQEATAVGVCLASNKDDYMFSNHRSHGHYLAKGGDLNAMIAEIFCRATGCSGGRGGSMHLCSPENGILGSTSIVAGCMGIGIGPALAEKVKGTNKLSIIFHGDCVPEEGLWHESLNLASVWKLPVLFVCENNLYAAHMPLNHRRMNDNILEIARGHGMPVCSVDGNNVLEINSVTKKAIEKIRNGEGPQFIESRTYRWLGHVGPNDDIDKGLRTIEELAFWKNRCPIKTFCDYLISTNVATQEQIDEMEKKVVELIDNAQQFAESSPYPMPETLLDNIYKTNKG